MRCLVQVWRSFRESWVLWRIIYHGGSILVDIYSKAEKANLRWKGRSALRKNTRAEKEGNPASPVMPVQQQNDYQDCGLFAIVFGTEIYRGKDPSKALLIQIQMRGHSFKRLTKKNMMPFPQFLKQERATLPHILTLHPKAYTLNVEVYFACHYDRRMIKCEEKRWFHCTCMGIRRKKPKVWKCGDCTQQKVNIHGKPAKFQTMCPAAKRQRAL